jgi:hypothetical protein
MKPLTREERVLLVLYRGAPRVARAVVAMELFDYARISHSSTGLNGADLRRFYRMSVRRLSRKTARPSKMTIACTI